MGSSPTHDRRQRPHLMRAGQRRLAVHQRTQRHQNLTKDVQQQAFCHGLNIRLVGAVYEALNFVHRGGG